MLKEGSRWIIGEGTKINIWVDYWLRDQARLAPNNPYATSFHDLCVKNLLLQDRKQWNMQMLLFFFYADDVSKITGVPLFHEAVEDRSIWAFNKQGYYTVKFGYRLFMDTFADLSHSQFNGDWLSLWKL